MKIINALLLALIICSLSLACKKDKLPQPTQTGANTMYAKINGQPWDSKPCWSCIAGGSGLSVSYDDRVYFGITGQNNDQHIVIGIYVNNLVKTGTYELSTNNSDYAILNSASSNFVTTVNHKGIITVNKIDLNNKIISGTFEFTAEDKENPENTIKVTDGWFDVKYRF